MPIVLFDDLDESSAWGWLEPVHDGARKPLLGQEVLIGRADIDLALGEESKVVSKHHFRVLRAGEVTTVADMSSNGTFLNGARLEREKDTALCHADLITLGGSAAARASPLISPAPPLCAHATTRPAPSR